MFQRLRSTSSSIEKLAILKTASELEKLIFRFTYDQGVTYGLNYAYVNYKTVSSLQDWSKLGVLLDNLSSRKLSGNAAREAVDIYAKENGDLIKLICNKDLDCGVSVGLLDKAFGKGFIKKFKVQLATEVPLEKVHFPILGEIKYNGVRIIALKYADGSVELKTRNGNIVPFPALQELISYYIPCETMIDGELTIGSSQNENHTTVSGLVTSAMRGTPIIRRGLVYHAFDCMPLQNFLSQSHNLQYHERRCNLNMLFQDSKELQYNQAIMRQGIVMEFAKVQDVNTVFDSVVKNGYEGLILKRRDHTYKFKRTTDWVKMKAWNDCDLICIGVTEGEGKYTGMIGGLICHGLVGDKFIEVVVSAGLTDAMRAASPDEYICKCIEIQYNTIIYDNTTDKYSLFIPKLIQVRTDK